MSEFQRTNEATGGAKCYAVGIYNLPQIVVKQGAIHAILPIMKRPYSLAENDEELKSMTPAQDRPLATATPWFACGISRAQWYKLYASGRTPLAIRLGTRRPVFLLAELEAWLVAGAPDRQSWERLKEETK